MLLELFTSFGFLKFWHQDWLVIVHQLEVLNLFVLVYFYDSTYGSGDLIFEFRYFYRKLLYISLKNHERAIFSQ